MGHRAVCRLRTHRRLWGLNQRELATLLGVRGANQISRLERGERTPSFEVSLACELLFGCLASELFPQVKVEVEETIMRRVYAMFDRLTGEETAVAQRKRELLEECLRRGTSNLKKKGV